MSEWTASTARKASSGRCARSRASSRRMQPRQRARDRPPDPDRHARGAGRRGAQSRVRRGRGGGAGDARRRRAGRPRRRDSQHLRNVILGAQFTIPLFVLSMGRDFGLFGHWAHEAWVNYVFLGAGDAGSSSTSGASFYTERGQVDPQRLGQHGRAGRARLQRGVFLQRRDHDRACSAGTSTLNVCLDHHPDHDRQAGRVAGEGPHQRRDQEADGLRAKTARVVRDGVETDIPVRRTCASGRSCWSAPARRSRSMAW